MSNQSCPNNEPLLPPSGGLLSHLASVRRRSRRCRVSLVVTVVLAAGLGGLASAEQHFETTTPSSAPPDPYGEAEQQCLTDRSCGGVHVIVIDGPSAVRAAEERKKLTLRAFAGIATDEEWGRLLHSIETWAPYEELLALYREQRDWRPEEPVPTPSTELERAELERADLERAELLAWYDLRRRMQPENALAWCTWVSQDGSPEALRELGRAVDEQPENFELRRCLVRHLAGHGKIDRAAELSKGLPPEPLPPAERDYAELFPGDHLAQWLLLRDYGGTAEQLAFLRARVEEHRAAEAPLPFALRILLLRIATIDGQSSAGQDTWLRLSGDASTALERSEVCMWLLEENSAAGDDCQARLDTELSPSRSDWPEQVRSFATVGDAYSLVLARGRQIEQAFAEGDFPRMYSVLRARPDFGAIGLWQDAFYLLEDLLLEDLQSENSPTERDPTARATDHEASTRGTLTELCGQLAEATRHGFGSRALDHLESCDLRFAGLVRLLEGCRLDAELGLLATELAGRLPALSDRVLRSLVSDIEKPFFEAVLTEVELRLASPGFDHELFDAMVNRLRPREGRAPTTLVAFLERHLEHRPEHLDAWYTWLGALDTSPKEEQRERLGETLALAIEAHPEHLDLRLWSALESLKSGHFARARSQAELILEPLRRASARPRIDSEPTPRQEAEAHYLLGRLDRLEGRFEEASAHFEHYFSTRFEFLPCPDGPIACDAPYRWHLLALGDWPRLDRHASRRQLAEERFPGRQLGPTGPNAGYFHTPMTPYEHLHLPPDRTFEAELGDPGCGLRAASDYLEALSGRDPAPLAVGERLDRQRGSSCLLDRDLPIDQTFAALDDALLDSMRTPL